MSEVGAASPRLRVPQMVPGLLVLSPAMAIFLSANVANVGNLAFNMLFSRWMGPALFGEIAVILTIKLAVLALLNALQMAVSRDVAEGRTEATALAAFSRRSLLLGFVALPPLVLVLWFTDAGQAFGLSHPALLLILAAALPFATPLCLARGVAMGRVGVKSTILSTQIEMLVRLGLGALAWHAGFGIAGVTAAIGLSILAGWLVIARETGGVAGGGHGLSRTAGRLALAALPFGLLQASQVILLDGEVILARLWLGAEASGHAAALSLFQRIAFFACFGLSSVLLPLLAAAHGRGNGFGQPLRQVAWLFAAVALPLMAGAVLMPETLLQVMVGEAFLPTAPLLWQAAAAALAFTASYLLATGLAATGDLRGILLVALCVPFQLTGMSLIPTGDASGLAALLGVKLVCQLLLLTLLTLLACRVLRRAGAHSAENQGLDR